MSLAWLRRSSRAVAAVLLVVSMWQLPHRAEDDAMCVPAAAEAHDESKHVFTSVADTSHPEHCAVCHWLRSLNPVIRTRGLNPVPAECASGPWMLVSRGLRDPGGDRIPARAPPSL